MAELSDEQTKQLQKKIDELQAKIDDLTQQLKDKADNKSVKRRVAEKTAFIAKIKTLGSLGEIPEVEDVQEAQRLLEDNLNFFKELLKAVVEAIKDVIQAIVDALTILKDFVVGLFPDEETETTMLGDRLPERGEFATFSTVPGVGDNVGIMRMPAGFAGLTEPMSISIKPTTVRLSARFEDGGTPGLSCVEIPSFAAVSQPIMIGERRLPAMLQTLDPRFTSAGMYNADTGEIKARLYTRAFDGQVYTLNQPILITSDVSGRLMSGATPTLQVSTRSIDFMSDAPIREYVC